MNIEHVLSQPLAEEFAVSGKSPNIPAAHTLAWEGLESRLGVDPLGAWDMKKMQHGFTADGVEWTAMFVRNPHFEIEA